MATLGEHTARLQKLQLSPRLVTPQDAASAALLAFRAADELAAAKEKNRRLRAQAQTLNHDPQDIVPALANWRNTGLNHPTHSPRRTNKDVAGATLNYLPGLYAARKDYLSRRSFTQMNALDPRRDPGEASVQKNGYVAAPYPPKVTVGPTRHTRLKGGRDGPGAKS